MADGKWISELEATTPLVDAARRVLTVRLQVVHDQLPLALHRWTEDCEHVHQLRVGTRRAGAALRTFAVCLPKKTFKRINKRLRQWRRAAGEARDWDVFAEALAEREQQAGAGQRPGLDFLIGYAQGQRVAAQATLEEVGQGTPFDYEALVAETLAAVQPPTGDGKLQQLCDLGRPCLADLVTELHEAGSANLEEYEHLHQVRILGKRLRYGMELFVSCFESDFQDHYYPMVEEMQDILGRANDSHVASQRLTFLRELLRGSRPTEWKRFRGGIEALLRYHQKRLPQQRRLFLKWWDRWRKSGAEAALTGRESAVSSTQ